MSLYNKGFSDIPTVVTEDDEEVFSHIPTKDQLIKEIHLEVLKLKSALEDAKLSLSRYEEDYYEAKSYVDSASCDLYEAEETLNELLESL